jgi:hypothetical protein
MSWQLPLVVMIVLAAVAYLARRTWRSLTARKVGGCGGGCGCAQAASAPKGQETLIPLEQVTLRNRRDGNPG